MKQYDVTGMSCAACSASVEKAVSGVPGVTACSVSLLTNSMGVEGDAPEEQIIAAVEKAGYGASVKGKSALKDDPLEDKETPLLKRRLISSLIVTAVLMYISMGHVMWGWPLPGLLADPMAAALIQLLLCGIVMVINQKFFISGFKGLINRSPNMDTLVALGSGASFAYSVCLMLVMTADYGAGDSAAAMEHLHGLYFESAAMILALITLGKMLEARSKGKTTNALKSLMDLSPKTATVIRNGREQEVGVEQVRMGDVFVLRPGASVPVDGIVLEGESALDESALTGESIPVDKAAGDQVSAATINQSGYLKCRATRVGEDTTLSQIIKMVSDAAATKAPIAKIADKVSGVFVPIVIALAAVSCAVWLMLGRDVGFALARGISVLVISCPCALGLATPVAIMVGNGMGAKNGILFKTSASLEETGRINIVALDKTGTITTGQPSVTDILPADGYGRDRLVELACSLESRSEHPLARAVMQYAGELGISPMEVGSFAAQPGNGLAGVLEGKPLSGGNYEYIGGRANVPEDMLAKARALADQGKTPLFFSYGGELAGVIAVADVIKEDSAEAVGELKNMGIEVVMLTGDNRRTANAIGRQAGVDRVIAEVKPDGKEQAIRELGRRGKVAMVGDGINDAPALTRADIGIAIGAGADVAIDAADLVLMKNSLRDVPAAIRLSRATLRNIHENLFWAFFYNVVCIPLAAGLFMGIGLSINPMIGAAAMSLSSFCVVTNALRLNLFRMYDGSRDKAIRKKDTVQEVKNMTKTMKIQGMMCPHCEGRVKKALEAIQGVESAEVSHQQGTAVVTLSEDVADDVLRQSVEAQDYPVISIE